jgi:site-specific DNA recombinase
MPAAIIYIRVSTKKQEQRNELNLPAQQQKCEDWAKRADIPVLKVFVGHGESAWKTDRPTLDEAIDFIKKNKGKVTHFIVQDTTRFARNDVVKAVACAELKKLNVTLISVDEPMLDDSPTGKLTGTMLTALGQFYSDTLSSRVRYRFEVHREQGRWLHQTPIGYVNVKQNGSKSIAPDPVTAPMVRQCFEMVASGSESSDAVRKFMTARGLRSKKGHKLSKQSFSWMLKNPLYAGVIMHKGKRYQGSFQSIVTEDVWQNAQDSLRGRRKAVPKKPTSEQWPLRGFVRCGFCGEKMTAGSPRGRGGKLYPKMWCWNPECNRPVSVSKEKIESEWIQYLTELQPAFDALVNVIPVLARTHQQSRADAMSGKRRELSTRLSEKKALQVELVTAKVKGEIAQDDFDVLKASLSSDITEIETALRALSTDADSLAELTADTTRHSVPASALWASVQLSERQTVQSALFPEGVMYRPDVRFFAPVTDDLQATVFEILVKIAAGRNDPEVLNGRDDWI